MRALGLATFLAVTPLSPALAGQIAGSQFQTGYWSGAAYTDDQTGGFLYCDVSVAYTNGEVLWFGLYNNDMMAVLMSHPDIRYRTGETFDAWVMMETGLPIRQVAEAWDESYAGITIDGIDWGVEYLSYGQWFRMLGIGIDDAYDVTGIADALAMARTCHAKHSGSNPFAVVAPPVAEPPVVEPEPQPLPEPEPQPLPEPEPQPQPQPALGTPPPMPKVPDLTPKPGGGLGTKPGGTLGTPAPKPAP